MERHTTLEDLFYLAEIITNHDPNKILPADWTQMLIEWLGRNTEEILNLIIDCFYSYYNPTTTKSELYIFLQKTYENINPITDTTTINPISIFTIWRLLIKK